MRKSINERENIQNKLQKNAVFTQVIAESVILKTRHMEVLVPWGDECLLGVLFLCYVERVAEKIRLQYCTRDTPKVDLLLLYARQVVENSGGFLGAFFTHFPLELVEHALVHVGLAYGTVGHKK